MASHFQLYVATLNRMRMFEMIDFYALQERQAHARASLVVNPLTSQFYDADTHGVVPPLR